MTSFFYIVLAEIYARKMRRFNLFCLETIAFFPKKNNQETSRQVTILEEDGI